MKFRHLLSIAAGLALACIFSPVGAQQQYDAGGKARTSQYCKTTVPGDTACPASPSFSATVSGFAPGGAYATVTAGAASARVALPAGTTVVGYNAGTTAVSCTLGNAAVVATANMDQISAGGFFAYTPGANVDIACIDQTGSASNLVVLSGGTGLPTGGVAGSGGGGGGAVTVADGADVTLGAKADAKSTATDTTAITIMQVLKQISASVQAPPSQAVTNAGTFVVQAGVAANNATQSGNPVYGAGTAVNAEPTLATNGQNAGLITDLAHKLIVAPYANPENLVQGTTAAMTGTTSTSLLAVPGSGLHNYVTNLTCVNSHATVGTFITVQDGSGGTALYTLSAASVFGGSTISFPAPLRQPTANTALFVADVTTGANVICSASGYKGQ